MSNSGEEDCNQVLDELGAVGMTPEESEQNERERRAAYEQWRAKHVGQPPQKVLEVWANWESVSVVLGDPDAAGVPGRHALEDWVIVLTETVNAVAHKVYPGSQQLMQEMLARVRCGIARAIEENDRQWEEDEKGREVPTEDSLDGQ